jgi:hypothetical protein
VEKLLHYYFSWIVSSRNRDKCEILPLETKQFGGKLLPHSDLWGGVFLGETPCGRSYSEEYRQKQKMQKKHHSFKIGTWNVKDLESRSTVYYSGGETAERGVAIVVHKSIVKSVVKKSVCSDRIIAVKSKAF